MVGKWPGPDAGKGKDPLRLGSTRARVKVLVAPEQLPLVLGQDQSVRLSMTNLHSGFPMAPTTYALATYHQF